MEGKQPCQIRGTHIAPQGHVAVFLNIKFDYFYNRNSLYETSGLREPGTPLP
jgi:hypothetical protein